MSKEGQRGLTHSLARAAPVTAEKTGSVGECQHSTDQNSLPGLGLVNIAQLRTRLANHSSLNSEASAHKCNSPDGQKLT